MSWWRSLVWWLFKGFFEVLTKLFFHRSKIQTSVYIAYMTTAIVITPRVMDSVLISRTPLRFRVVSEIVMLSGTKSRKSLILLDMILTIVQILAKIWRGMVWQLQGRKCINSNWQLLSSHPVLKTKKFLVDVVPWLPLLPNC